MNLNGESENEEVWEVEVDNTNAVNYTSQATKERKKYGYVLPLTRQIMQNTSWANKPSGPPRTPERPVRGRSVVNRRRTHKTRPRFEPSPPPVERQKRPGQALNAPNQKRSKGGKRKTYRRRK
jgi:hypothetical protein